MKKQVGKRNMSMLEYRELIAEQEAHRGARVKGYRSTEYKGRKYDSLLEARCAMWLDSFVTDGSLSEVAPQHRIDLKAYGRHITTHIVDFIVTLADGRQKYVEAKGYATDVWAIKRRLTEAQHPDIPYLVYTSKRPLTAKELLQ